MTKSTRKKTLIVVAVVLLIATSLVVLSSGRLFGRETYIDVASGRLLRRTHICGIRLQGRIENTAFSRLVADLGLASDGTTDYRWKLVSRIEYGVSGITRVQATHGGAPPACRNLVEWFDLAPEVRGKPYTREEKREIVARLLELLQQEDDRHASTFVSSLMPEQ